MKPAIVTTSRRKVRDMAWKASQSPGSVEAVEPTAGGGYSLRALDTSQARRNKLDRVFGQDGAYRSDEMREGWPALMESVKTLAHRLK